MKNQAIGTTSHLLASGRLALARRVGTLAIIGAAASALGCSSDKPNFDLLADSSPSTSKGTPEEARLASMQMIVVEKSPGDANSPPVVEPVTPYELMGAVFTGCMDEVTPRTLGTNEPSCGYGLHTDCSSNVCWSQSYLCAAHQYLDIAAIRAEPVALANGWRIYAQSNAVNAALATSAKDAAKNAMEASAQALYDASISNSAFLGNECSNSGAAEVVEYTLANGETQSERRAVTLARSFVESVNLFREATESGSKATLAVSDAELNSGPRSVGIERSVSNTALSRIAAARAFVGGAPFLMTDNETFISNGFPGFVAGRQDSASLPKGGFCTDSDLTPQAQSALSVLREAAPAPTDILNAGLSIGELLDGTSPSDGSVHARLADYWGTVVASTDIAKQLNLENEDFVQARRFMAQEILAFSRSMVAKQKRTRADGTVTNYYAYGATARAAEQPSSAYYAALARYDIDYRDFSNDWFASVPGLPHFENGGYVRNSTISLQVPHQSLADGLDYAITFATVLTEHSGGFYNSATWRSIKDLIGTVAGMSDRAGRMRFCHWTTNESRVWAQGYAASDAIILVEGEDALACAVKGTVEGLPCSMRDYAPLVLNAEGVPDAGFTSAAYATFGAPDPDKRYYLLKPKPEAAAVTCEAADASCIPELRAPGNYVALIGVTYPGGARARHCLEAAIVPEAEARAALVLAPSEKSCSHSRVNCAGGSFDERMPLENELADDNDGVESSWKHYLSLARQAADEADALGEQYIQRGLDVDYREEEVSVREEQKRQQVETALDELQSACGTAMDTSSLLTFLSGESGDDLTNFALGSCDADSPCDSGYKCVMNVCIVDLPAKIAELGSDGNPDMLRLAECLDPGATERRVHLGEKESTVCIWHGTGSKANELCALPTDCDPTKSGNQKCVAAQHQCPALPEVDLQAVDLRLACRKLGGCKASELNCGSALGFGGYSAAQLSSIGIEIEPVSIGLGYFPLAAATNQSKGNLCDTIRKNRTNPGSDMDGLQALVNSNLLHPLKAKEAAKLVGFEARLGGFAALTKNGAPWFATGSPWCSAPNSCTTAEPGYAQSDWPCKGKASFATCAANGGLFCDLQKDCSDPVQRSAINSRLLRAVIAARVLTEQFAIGGKGENIAGHSGGLDPLGIVQPYYGRPDKYDPSFSIRDLYTGVPVLAGQNSLPSQFPPIGQVAIYKTDAPSQLPVAPYYDEAGVAAGVAPSATLLNRTGYYNHLFDDDPAYSFIEMGLPRPPGLDEGGGLAALEGLSAGATNVHTGTLYSVLANELKYNTPLSPFTLPLDVCPGRFGNDDHHEYFIYPVYPSGRDRYGKDGDDCNINQQPMPIGQTTFSYDREEILDGLELLCDASGESQGCDLSSPPTIQSVNDLGKASSFLSCAANAIRNRAALTVFSNLPKRAIDALRSESVVGTYPALGGDLGTAVSDIRSGMVAIAQTTPLISNELEQLGIDIKTIQGTLARSAIRDKISDLQFMSQTADRIAQCASVDVGSFGFNNVVSCSNAIAQISFASGINQLAAEDETIARELALNDFTSRFADRAKNMQGYALNLVAASESIDRGLIAFEATQKRAERAVVRALYAASFHAKNEMEITSVLQQRKRTDQLRYQQALQNAIRMSFLAKRSIELRLGMHLSDLQTDLPLVPAPSTWEATLCARTGVDYEKLRQNASTAPGSKVPPKDFADAYIGDYVTKLENLVESYRLEFGFHEGSDVAIASLRDDVMNVRAECPVDSGNLLYQAGQIDQLLTSTSSTTGTWRLSGCRLNASGEPLPSCITAQPRTAPAFSTGLPSVSAARAYDLLFGKNGSDCTGTACGFQQSAELVQTVNLEPGRYRFSWYECDDPAHLPCTDPTSARIKALSVIRDGTGTLIDAAAGTPIPASGDTWSRPFVTFDLDKPQAVTVGFRQPGLNVATASVSAPLLEHVNDLQRDLLPGIFVNTGSTLTNTLPACEDTDGTVFRATSWKRGCLLLCKDGFSNDCTGASAATHCYREAKFSINQRAIEAGKMFKSGGFARGNFNYRIDTLALNFVGTGTRDCANSPTPSTCYGGGFIPYSLEHLGPYYVRNHLGQDFRGDLFTGKIEHARGLAAERYLTNPLSSDDRSLLTDYLRTELRGRPLDGNFVVRVWEDDGVDFDAIDDVQIVLNYRYWTRFD